MALPSPGIQFSPPAFSGEGGAIASFGQALWDVGRSAAGGLQAGIDHLTSSSEQTSEYQTLREQENQSDGVVLEEGRMSIGELMKREKQKYRPLDVSLHQSAELESLRGALRKASPGNIRETLNLLNRSSPSSLDVATGLLATAGNVHFIGDDGISHSLSGTSVEALRVGSTDLQAWLDELGPVVAYFPKEGRGVASSPSFFYDMRQFYRPSEALAPDQMRSVYSTSRGGDSFEFYQQRPELLEDLIKGFGTGIPLLMQRNKYVFSGPRQNRLPRLTNLENTSKELVESLMGGVAVPKENAHTLILADLLGQPSKQIEKTLGIGGDLLLRRLKKLNEFFNHGTDLNVTEEKGASAALALHSEMKKEKLLLEKYIREQEESALSLLAGKGRPFKSIQQARTAMTRGNEWLDENWAPRDTEDAQARVGDLTRFQDEIRIDILHPPLPKASDSMAKPERVSLTADELEAIVIFHRWKYGTELKSHLLSPLYKLFRGLGPVMQLKERRANSPKEASHFVLVSDFFKTFFEKTWKDTPRLMAERDLMKSRQGHEADFYRHTRKMLKDIIRDGREQIKFAQSISQEGHALASATRQMG